MFIVVYHSYKTDKNLTVLNVYIKSINTCYMYANTFFYLIMSNYTYFHILKSLTHDKSVRYDVNRLSTVSS